MMDALSLKIVAAVFGITAFVLSVAGYLTYSNFEKSTLSLIEGRSLHTVRELRGAIQTGLSLGLPLATMSNVQGIIARELNKDPQIATIAVFDSGGRPVFAVGDRDAATLPEMHEPCGSAEWCDHLAHSVVVGTPLIDAVGLPAGNVALWYSQAGYETLKTQMRHRIVWSGGAILSVVAAAAMVLIPRFLALFCSSHEKMRRVSDAAIRGDAVDDLSDTDADGADRNFAAAIHATSDVINHIGACGNDLRHLHQDQ